MEKDNNIYLIIGLSITGCAVGYMVGGSGTPVVGVAIPLIFGLIVSSFGLFQPYKQIKNLPENITNNKDLIRDIFDKIENRAIISKKYIGLTLIFFSSFYLIGTLIGSNVRINEWFVVRENQTLPWENGNEPVKINDALNWIVLEAKLKKLGFTNKDVKSLYEIQIAEWNSATKVNNIKSDETGELKALISELQNVIQSLKNKDLIATDSSSDKTTSETTQALSSILDQIVVPKQPSTNPFENKNPFENFKIDFGPASTNPFVFEDMSSKTFSEMFPNIKPPEGT